MVEIGVEVLRPGVHRLITAGKENNTYIDYLICSLASWIVRLTVKAEAWQESSSSIMPNLKS